MKIRNLLTIIDKKHHLYVFFLFETSKSWNCWPFYPTGTMSRIHTFQKRQCDRCRHRSAVKNTPPPSLSFPVPSLPPTLLPPQRQLPRANDIGPFGSGEAVTSSANGVASLAHSIGNPLRSAPSPPPAQCRQNWLFQGRKRSLTRGRVR
jgi:hypothetical protein